MTKPLKVDRIYCVDFERPSKSYIMDGKRRYIRSMTKREYIHWSEVLKNK